MPGGARSSPWSRACAWRAARSRAWSSPGSPGTRTPDPGASAGSGMGLTVAVTGPTGEIGRSAIRALERSDEVQRIVGMARRPFDPAAHGWRKTSYRQGDILDRAAVDRLVRGADVVLHLAFVI